MTQLIQRGEDAWDKLANLPFVRKGEFPDFSITGLVKFVDGCEGVVVGDMEAGGGSMVENVCGAVRGGHGDLGDCRHDDPSPGPNVRTLTSDEQSVIDALASLARDRMVADASGRGEEVRSVTGSPVKRKDGDNVAGWGFGSETTSMHSMGCGSPNVGGSRGMGGRGGSSFSVEMLISGPDRVDRRGRELDLKRSWEAAVGDATKEGSSRYEGPCTNSGNTGGWSSDRGGADADLIDERRKRPRGTEKKEAHADRNVGISLDLDQGMLPGEAVGWDERDDVDGNGEASWTASPAGDDESLMKSEVKKRGRGRKKSSAGLVKAGPIAIAPKVIDVVRSSTAGSGESQTQVADIIEEGRLGKKGRRGGMEKSKQGKFEEKGVKKRLSSQSLQPQQPPSSPVTASGLQREPPLQPHPRIAPALKMPEAVHLPPLMSFLAAAQQTLPKIAPVMNMGTRVGVSGGGLVGRNSSGGGGSGRMGRRRSSVFVGEKGQEKRVYPCAFCRDVFDTWHKLYYHTRDSHPGMLLDDVDEGDTGPTLVAH
ncbi:hypothetical protein HDV00_010400 [Rhizophlyctis rosea]|nr:hypothetical protein HDV00_010400 [Rhizophlyctis rosea]